MKESTTTALWNQMRFGLSQKRKLEMIQKAKEKSRRRFSPSLRLATKNRFVRRLRALEKCEREYRTNNNHPLAAARLSHAHRQLTLAAAEMQTIRYMSRKI